MQAHAGDRLVGAIVSKAEKTKAGRLRGYIAMLVVDPDFRKGGIGMRLAAHTISKMRATCDEVRVGPRMRSSRSPLQRLLAAYATVRRLTVIAPAARLFDPALPSSCPDPAPVLPSLQIVLETEATNASALRLYEALGFVRDKRLARYYLNGNDAYRLKLWVR